MTTDYHPQTPTATPYNPDLSNRLDSGLSRLDLLPVLYRLHSAGMWCVLCHGKAAFQLNWLRRRLPWDEVEAHVRDGGEIGHVPGHMGLTVVDVDRGDYAALVAMHPPRVVLPSRRPGRAHLYYDDRAMRGNAKWAFAGCGGEIRSGSGHVVLWGDAPIHFERSFWQNGAFPFPDDIFSAMGVEIEDAPVQTPLIDVASVPLDDLSTVEVGNRNVALFHTLRTWAYAQTRPQTRTAWDHAVFRRAQQLNAGLGVPLPTDEVRSTARSVSKGTWDPGTRPGDTSSDAQARRGRRSGMARRTKTGKRDSQILARVSDGETYAEIARDLGLHRNSVAKIVQRDAPLIAGLARRGRKGGT